MYSLQRLTHTLAIGLAFAALAVVASDEPTKPLCPPSVAGDTSGSSNLITTSALELSTSRETATMKRGRADVQAMKKRSGLKKGRLAISEDYNNGHFSRYVSAKLNDYGGYGLTTTDPNEALTIDYLEYESGSQSLQVTGYAYSWIAAVPGTSPPNYNLAQGTSHVVLTPGQNIPPQSPPQAIFTSLTDHNGVPVQGESGIFHVAPAGENRPYYRDVYPQWVNPDGKVSPQEFYILNDGLKDHVLGVTGDFTQLSSRWSEIRRVRLLIAQLP